MRDLVVNESVTCPCCGERIVVAVDTSVPEQQYVEDCSICCRPLVVSCSTTEGSVLHIALSPESE